MVLISHERMFKIHTEKERVKNKSDNINLNSDLISKLNEKYGEADFGTLQMLISNAKAGMFLFYRLTDIIYKI